jgi:hypothetical protein
MSQLHMTCSQSRSDPDAPPRGPTSPTPPRAVRVGASEAVVSYSQGEELRALFCRDVHDGDVRVLRRIRQGLDAARARGTRLGRPPAMTTDPARSRSARQPGQSLCPRSRDCWASVGPGSTGTSLSSPSQPCPPRPLRWRGAGAVLEDQSAVAGGSTRYRVRTDAGDTSPTARC